MLVDDALFQGKLTTSQPLRDECQLATINRPRFVLYVVSFHISPCSTKYASFWEGRDRGIT